MLLLEFLQRILHGLAPLRQFAHAVPRGLHLGAVRFSRADLTHAAFRLLFAFDTREQKAVGERRRRYCDKGGQRQNGDVYAEHRSS
ncbi:hypothetical protein D9M68_254740 [compost metagenome]